MDLVTLIGACAIGAGSALSAPLGTHSDCRSDIGVSQRAAHDAVNSAVDRWSSLIEAVVESEPFRMRIKRNDNL